MRGRTAGGTRRGNPLEDLLGRLHGDGAGATATQAGTRPGARVQDGDGRAAGRGVRHGDDVDVEIDLSLEEAFHGSARLVQVGDRRLEVKVPRGVETGSKIRLRGKAGSGSDSGDLYLVAKIRPHPVFTRNGADLTRELPITLGEALLGGEAEVETLGGRVVLKIPPGTQQGQTFRLAGKGMPRLKGEGSGDLYARVKVVLPGKLEGKQRQAAEEFLRQIVQPNPRTRTRRSTSLVSVPPFRGHGGGAVADPKRAHLKLRSDDRRSQRRHRPAHCRDRRSDEPDECRARSRQTQPARQLDRRGLPSPDGSRRPHI